MLLHLKSSLGADRPALSITLCLILKMTAFQAIRRLAWVRTVECPQDHFIEFG